MRNRLCRSIERFPRLKTDRNGFIPAQVHNLLNTRPGGSLGNQNLFERAIGPKRLSDRM
jgi:hypothetical protein